MAHAAKDGAGTYITSRTSRMAYVDQIVGILANVLGNEVTPLKARSTAELEIPYLCEIIGCLPKTNQWSVSLEVWVQMPLLLHAWLYCVEALNRPRGHVWKQACYLTALIVLRAFFDRLSVEQHVTIRRRWLAEYLPECIDVLQYKDAARHNSRLGALWSLLWQKGDCMDLCDLGLELPLPPTTTSSLLLPKYTPPVAVSSSFVRMRVTPDHSTLVTPSVPSPTAAGPTLAAPNLTTVPNPTPLIQMPFKARTKRKAKPKALVVESPPISIPLPSPAEPLPPELLASVIEPVQQPLPPIQEPLPVLPTPSAAEAITTVAADPPLASDPQRSEAPLSTLSNRKRACNEQESPSPEETNKKARTETSQQENAETRLSTDTETVEEAEPVRFL